jgi:hypothetical protein
MSIAGVSSSFSVSSTTDVQPEEQYTEDAQLLAQTLQTQSLQSPALVNPAQSETSDLLNSVQPPSASSTTNLLENASSTAGGVLASLDLTSLDQGLSTAPSQAASFGIGAPGETTGITNAGATNTSPNGPTVNSASNDNPQTGPLQALIQEIQEQAQQAYTAAQQGYAGVNTGTTTLAPG